MKLLMYLLSVVVVCVFFGLEEFVVLLQVRVVDGAVDSKLPMGRN
jgi:hypothetical protein